MSIIQTYHKENETNLLKDFSKKNNIGEVFVTSEKMWAPIHIK